MVWHSMGNSFERSFTQAQWTKIKHSIRKLLGNIETFTFLYVQVNNFKTVPFLHHFYWKTWQIFLHSSTVIFRSDFLEKWWIKGTFKKLSTCNLPKFTLKSVEVLELFNAQSNFYIFTHFWGFDYKINNWKKISNPKKCVKM